MKSVNFTILLIFSFLIAVQTSAAQSTNPFEIKSRLKGKKLNTQNDTANIAEKLNDTTSKVANDSFVLKSGNPFDIDRNIIDSLAEEYSAKGKTSTFTFALNKNHLKKVFTGNSSAFLIWILLLGLIIIAILISMNRETVLKIIKSSWFNNLMNLLHRNFGNKDYLLYSLLYVSFILNIAIFLYIVLQNNLDMNGIALFGYLFLIVISIYIFKHLAIYLFESVFTSLKGIRIYSFSVMIFNIILGFALIPVNAFAAFSTSSIAEFFIVIGVVLISIFYVFRLFRGFLSTYNYFAVSIFHFFIYLCAFEILPLLILYKVVVSF